jgi:hypothetical protein
MRNRPNATLGTPALCPMMRLPILALVAVLLTAVVIDYIIQRRGSHYRKMIQSLAADNVEGAVITGCTPGDHSSPKVELSRNDITALIALLKRSETVSASHAEDLRRYDLTLRTHESSFRFAIRVTTNNGVLMEVTSNGRFRLHYGTLRNDDLQQLIGGVCGKSP